MGPCTAGKFSCLTKKGQKCLPDNLKCDGAEDCLEAVDENECERCNDTLFTCTSSNTTHLECHAKRWVCDNHIDCSDGSDEHNCHTTDTPENTTHAQAPAKKTRVPRTGKSLVESRADVPADEIQQDTVASTSEASEIGRTPIPGKAEMPQADAPYTSSKLTTTPKGIITQNSIDNRSMSIKDGNGLLDFFRSWHGLAVMSISVVCITLIVVIVLLVRCRKSSKMARIRISRAETEMDDIHQSILHADMSSV